jgi:hypothetical protein
VSKIIDVADGMGSVEFDEESVLFYFHSKEETFELTWDELWKMVKEECL